MLATKELFGERPLHIKRQRFSQAKKGKDDDYSPVV